MKRKILVLNGQYAPGYKGGGPIQSCINIVENLYNEFEFYIVCADRDYKDNKSYSDVKINEWNRVGHANVYYLSPENQGLNGFRKILNETEYDCMYLNGFFSPIFTIRPLLLRLLKKIPDKPVILTPRGDFTGGCENKKIKKYSYIYLTKLIGLYKRVIWHATSELEDKDIKIKYPGVKTVVVPNLPAHFEEKPRVVSKNKNELRLVFVSRIFPKKNIKYALEVLRNIKVGNVIFDIYGPMEDKNYWDECKALIEMMPSNITVSYKEEVEHKRIPDTFSQYHAFFFPTLGENYGHVIVEAMMNNCLCILSKGVTPWDDYEECGNFIHDLDDKSSFCEAIDELIAMDDIEFQRHLSLNNYYIKKKVDAAPIVDKYKKMFSEGYKL